MSTSSLTDRLRAELAADLDAAADKSLAAWLVTAVDTVVAFGLVARTMCYACVYAINHNEPGAEIAFSVTAEPLTADWWTLADRLQASLVGPIAVAWFIAAHEFGAMPRAWFGFLAVNAAVLVVDPIRVVVWEVRD